MNGNVKNSVNLPALSLARQGKARIAAVTAGDCAAALKEQLTACGVTVNAEAAGTKKNAGYCVFDTDAEITDGIVDALKAVDGVRLLRIL